MSLPARRVVVVGVGHGFRSSTSPEAEEHDVLGDVRHPVADPLEVMRGEQDPRPRLDVARVRAHQLEHLVEDRVVQVVDLVVEGRDLARALPRPCRPVRG